MIDLIDLTSDKFDVWMDELPFTNNISVLMFCNEDKDHEFEFTITQSGRKILKQNLEKLLLTLNED